MDFQRKCLPLRACLLLFFRIQMKNETERLYAAESFSVCRKKIPLSISLLSSLYIIQTGEAQVMGPAGVVGVWLELCGHEVHRLKRCAQ